MPSREITAAEFYADQQIQRTNTSLKQPMSGVAPKSHFSKPGIITTPSGREYTWSNPNPPTESDFKAILDYEAAQGIEGTTIWWDTTPPGFKEVNGESATGLILFSPSGRRFQWTNSNPLTQSDIDQLGRLKTESVGIIKNPLEVSTLLNRTSTGLFLTGWVVSLLAAFAVSWILARRRYNRQSGVDGQTIQETESIPASFRRASLGVRRLASALFWLFTIGCSSIAVMAADYDLRVAFVGPVVGMTFWGLIRGVDWIVRGFKFGGYDIDGKR